MNRFRRVTARSVSLAGLALAATTISFVASAQSDGSQRGPIEEVVVTGEGGTYAVKESAAATKLNLSLRDTPQSMTVITRERLDDQNLVSK